MVIVKAKDKGNTEILAQEKLTIYLLWPNAHEFNLNTMPFSPDWLFRNTIISCNPYNETMHLEDCNTEEAAAWLQDSLDPEQYCQVDLNFNTSPL